MTAKRRVAAMPFTWSVTGGIEALSVLAGIRFDRMFTELDAIVSAYRDGGRIAREWFGPDISFGGPRWAGISYGHVNCLGSELIFPEDSEVVHTPVYNSLSDGIRALRRDVDFSRAGLFPFYLDLWAKLKRVFPGQAIPFDAFGAEGPLTTAWLLRGHDFFMDIYDDPPRAKEYLVLVTDSIVKYRKLLARINHSPERDPRGAGIADDGAAMIPPHLWPELVVPHIEQYFTALTSGGRSAHIEDLAPDHLGFLDALRLTSFDPSVSKKLSPSLILARCRVPFTWRFNVIEGASYSPAQTRHWVFAAAAQGAPAVRTDVWRNNCTERGRANILAFVDAARAVQRLLAKGLPRDRLEEEEGKSLPAGGQDGRAAEEDCECCRRLRSVE